MRMVADGDAEPRMPVDDARGRPTTEDGGQHRDESGTAAGPCIADTIGFEQ